MPLFRPLDAAARLARDPASRLPTRFPVAAWLTVLLAFVLAYGFLFTVVHPFVDTRICVAQIPDPLFGLIPYDGRWYRVSHELFYVVTALVMAGLIYQAVRGEHRPFLRFALGISLQAPLRALTMTLLPLCKVSVLPGHRALESVPTLNLGFAHIPFLSWATNDLVFSGHVAEFLILYFAVRSFWPRAALVALVVFQILEAVALVATRGHYTVDIVIAVPFAFFVDRVAVALLERWPRATP